MPNISVALRGNAGLALTMLFWGSLIPVIGIVLPVWDAFAVSALRYGLAAPLVAATLVLAGHGAGLRDLIDPRTWWLGAGIAGYATLTTVGIALSNPVTAAIVSSTGPAVSIAVAWLGFGVRPAPGTALAIVLAIVGGTLATVGGSAAQGASIGGGELLIVLGAVSWTWYSLKAQHWMPARPQIEIAGVTILTGAAWLVLIDFGAVALGLARPPAFAVPAPYLALLGWMAVGCTALGIFFWNYGVRWVGIGVASIYLNLVPVCAVLISAALGSTPRPAELLGGALILAGVIQMQLRHRSPNTAT